MKRNRKMIDINEFAVKAEGCKLYNIEKYNENRPAPNSFCLK